MTEVTIGGGNYNSFASHNDADTYLAADLRLAANWDGASSDQQGRALVSATRMLERLPWAEVPSYDSPPQAVIDATCLLAGELILKPALTAGGGTGSNVKSVKAGSTGVEFFKGVKGAPNGLPQSVFDLIKGLLSPAGGSAASYGLASGTDTCSRFDPTDYQRTEGFH